MTLDPSSSDSRRIQPAVALPPWCELPGTERPAQLRDVSMADLRVEFLARMVGSPRLNQGAIDGGRLVADVLRSVLDVHENRFSFRRYRDMFDGSYSYLAKHGQGTPDRPTFVDVGCGSWNPYGVSFLFLCIGAARAYALDMDPIENESKATRALADLAAEMLVNPSDIIGELELSPIEVLRNLEGFDLPKLHAGDPTGVDPTRLVHALTPAQDMPVGDAEADLVMSNAFFEHVHDVDAVAHEMARVTHPGGIGVHVVDATDHRRYYDSSIDPLDYLTEDFESEALFLSAPNGVRIQMNRLRPWEYEKRFANAGFELVGYEPFRRVEVSEARQAEFVEPYRSMRREQLGELMARLVLRRL